MSRLVLWSLLWMPASSWAAEEAPRANPMDPGNLLQVVMSLLLVLLLIGGLAWLLRRVNGLQAAAGSAIRVLAAASVGHRERVVLVQVGEQQLLLGVAPGRVQTLHVLEQPVDVSQPKTGERFAERFAQALKKRGESS